MNVDRAGGCCSAKVRRGRDVLVAPLDCPTAAALSFVLVTPLFPRVDAVGVLGPMPIRPTRLSALSSTTRLVRRANRSGGIAGPISLAGGANGCISLSIVAVL